ncbi:hypothetical protein PC116_g1309 [Phytophthora cactorum]|nr:hypothetical protein PC119_g11101 [Phytophthora cactorum]KAG3179677.1 hypothetical protein PC128_g15847 [Phytophthora cactorum]KAG4251021.1 hypothetical protein PC116_g1309 [Phytophthora cactorum]
MTVAALKHNSEDLWFMPGAIGTLLGDAVRVFESTALDV